MPPVVIRGVGPVLRGRSGQRSRIVFGADHVRERARVVITGFGTDGTLYLWTGEVTAADILRPGKVRTMVTCTSGHALEDKGKEKDRKKKKKKDSEKRVTTGPGDVIDVTVTVTNEDEPPVTENDVVEIG